MSRAGVAFAVLALVSVALGWLSLHIGPTSPSDADLLAVVTDLRAARSAVAYAAGAALSVAGVMVQGLFRNPLASPSILGTSGGASLGGKLSLLAFQALATGEVARTISPDMFLPIGCLLGALMGLGLLLLVLKASDDPVTLLLCGFLLSALFLSFGSFVTSLAQESWELGRAVISFALGSVSGAGWRQVALVAPLVALGTLAALTWARPLDMMLSGEEEARALGLDVGRVRAWTIAWVAVLTAGAVAVGGNVGFVGLVVPHGLRRFVGVSHHQLLPAAALGGGAFLLACDILTRAIPAHSEIPLGVVTGLIGAPLFLWMLLRMQQERLHG